MATLTERFATLTVENMRLTDSLKSIPERCAVISETESEPNGQAPEALKAMPLEDAIRLAVQATKASIARRIRKEFDLIKNAVSVRIAATTSENENGLTVESIAVTCTKCNYSVYVWGRGERSIKRGCSMLRQQCPRKESNFYVEDNDL